MTSVNKKEYKKTSLQITYINMTETLIHGPRRYEKGYIPLIDFGVSSDTEYR